MKQEIRDEWVKRLRSGDYEQGLGYLRHGEEGEASTYCCLGVLCEIAVEAGVIPPARTGTEGHEEDVWLYGNENERDDTGLPHSVRMWAGVTSASGLVIDGPVSNLVVANDSEHMSFAEIADIIEKHEIR